MPPLLMKLMFNKVRTAPVPFFIRPVLKSIADKVTRSFIAPIIGRPAGLHGGRTGAAPRLAGQDFRVADIAMNFPLEAAASRGGLDTRYPKPSDSLTRIHARPAYQRALERAGPWQLL